MFIVKCVMDLTKVQKREIVQQVTGYTDDELDSTSESDLNITVISKLSEKALLMETDGDSAEESDSDTLKKNG